VGVKDLQWEFFFLGGGSSEMFMYVNMKHLEAELQSKSVVRINKNSQSNNK